MRDTIDMAREAGFTEGELAFMGDNFRRFAELARADERKTEREKFATLCNELAIEATKEKFPTAVTQTLNILAMKIRARGNNL